MHRGDAVSTARTMANNPELTSYEGTWPAFWALSATATWPAGGEIDIIEGVHDNVHNQVTWHTNPGCNLTETGNFTGTPVVSINSCHFRFWKAVLPISGRANWIATLSLTTIPDVVLPTGVASPTERPSTSKEAECMPCFGMKQALQFVSSSRLLRSPHFFLKAT